MTASPAQYKHRNPRKLLGRSRSKYHAVPTVVDGIRFASKAEARRYAELRLLEKAGEIRGLCCQPKFDLTVKGVLIGHYIADFSYQSRPGEGWDGPWRMRTVFEDVKGVRTPLYQWKKKHVEAEYGVKIIEVRA